jgi:TRAP-type C4-dicarboxylate transport system substrate-binding protein
MGIKQSRVADATMRALGARPVPYASGGAIRGFDGAELDISTTENYSADMKFVTANVNLWPRPVVVFAKRTVFDSLTGEQQAILRRAVATVASRAVEAVWAKDRENAILLCGRGVAFREASQDDLDALRQAVQPVYDELERDPETKTFITKIEAMRRQVGASPDTVHCRTR